MGADQRVAHVGRMGGGVAQSFEAVDGGETEEKIGEARVAVPPGVDVLAEERDLARAAGDEGARFGLDGGGGARGLGAAGVGDDAKGAEFVAAFLDREEGGGAAQRAGFGKRVEFRDSGKARVAQRAARGAVRPRDHFRQAVVALRPDNDVHEGGAPDHLGAFGLRHAARDGEDHAFAPRRFGVAQAAQAAEFGIDLLAGLFADMAGVEERHVGVFRRGGGAVSERRQKRAHALRVVDVHLAPVGAHIEPARWRRCARRLFVALLQTAPVRSRRPHLRRVAEQHWTASPRAVKARAASRQGRLRGRRISVDERAGAVQEWLRKSRAGCPLCRVAC